MEKPWDKNKGVWAEANLKRFQPVEQGRSPIAAFTNICLMKNCLDSSQELCQSDPTLIKLS